MQQFLIFRIFDNGKINPARSSIYACGEKWEAKKMSSSAFYDTIIDAFRIKKLSGFHTGDVSDYLFWVFSSIVIMMLVFSVW